MSRATRKRLLGVISVLVFLGFWELAGRVGWVNTRFVSSPTLVLDAGWEMILDGSIFPHIRTSAMEFAVGYALAAVLGVGFGIGMGWYRRANAAVDPHITFLYVIPQVALLPLVMIWFGIGMWSKVALVFITAFPSIVISVRTGVRDVEPTLLRCARSFKATDRQIFWSIVLPACVPHIMTALRVASGRALVGMVVAELIGATAGLGFLISSSSSSFQMDKAYWAILIVGCSGIAMNMALGKLEARFQSWRPVEVKA